MDLSTWTREFVKARDKIRRELAEKPTQAGDELTCVYTDKTQHFLVAPQLRVPSDPRDFYIVVCLNNEENLRFLLEHWDAFSDDHISVIFCNPDAHKYWRVNPRVHASIADPETLEQGLRSMAADVPTV